MSDTKRLIKGKTPPVTGRKMRAVRRQEDRTLALLRLAIDASSDAVTLYDQEDRLVFANRAYAHMFGGDLEPGTRFEDLMRAQLERLQLRARGSAGLQPGDQRLIEMRLAQYLDARSQGESEREMRTLDGRWIQLSDQRTADGLTLTRVTDVTRRRLAEDSALAATQRLRDGLEHLGEMIALTDADDVIVLANRRFLEFNARVAEYCRPGCHYGDHLRAGVALGMFPDANGREEAWLAERLAIRRQAKGPVERRRQDGRWLMVDDQVLPDGGIVSFGVEITQRKQTEAA
jgi:PAS domain-containing protein